jgi:hypothetical protein
MLRAADPETRADDGLTVPRARSGTVVPLLGRACGALAAAEWAEPWPGETNPWPAPAGRERQEASDDDRTAPRRRPT